RGSDCTLEATLLLNQPIEQAIATLAESHEQDIAQRLLEALHAEPDRQVTYQAIRVYQETGIDPRQVDPILVKLAEQQQLIYRAYNRGITFKLTQLQGSTSTLNTLRAIENDYERRYQIFEQRMQAMLKYIWMKGGCRSEELIGYLTGEDIAEPCMKCD